MDLLDVVVEVEVEVSRLADVLGIRTGLSADDIKDRGGDNLDMTDLAIFSPGRSKLPPYFLRSRKFGILGPDILTTGDSDSNNILKKYETNLSQNHYFLKKTIWEYSVKIY